MSRLTTGPILLEAGAGRRHTSLGVTLVTKVAGRDSGGAVLRRRVPRPTPVHRSGRPCVPTDDRDAQRGAWTAAGDDLR